MAWALQDAKATFGAVVKRAQTEGPPEATVGGEPAATAIVHNLTLVTRKTRDFDDLPLDLVNPWAD